MIKETHNNQQQPKTIYNDSIIENSLKQPLTRPKTFNNNLQLLKK